MCAVQFVGVRRRPCLVMVVLRCPWPARDEDDGWRRGRGHTDAALHRDGGNGDIGSLQGEGRENSLLREAWCTWFLSGWLLLAIVDGRGGASGHLCAGGGVRCGMVELPFSSPRRLCRFGVASVAGVGWLVLCSLVVVATLSGCTMSSLQQWSCRGGGEFACCC